MVSYVDAGRDATVSYGSIDFKFKNSRSYPIKLKADASNGIVNISILGVQEKNEYVVEVVTNVTEVIPFEVQYVKDLKLAVGSQLVKQTGYDGSKCSAYKIVSLNGSVVSKTLLSTDTYKPMSRIVKIKKKTR
ncbi:G5 domain protein [compost metagenome]